MSKQKVALITGITGQDGSYLAEYLKNMGYRVHGVLRPHHLGLKDQQGALKSIDSNGIDFHYGELSNPLAMLKLFSQVKPDECYHLAAPSFVSYDLQEELSNFHSGFNATHSLATSLLEAAPHCRLYFAGSSEMFGHAISAPQDEGSPMRPRSMYGISKLAGYHLLRTFREKFGLFTSTGILYNHESPRRAQHFVTRKITLGVARIKLGLDKELRLGNLDVQRDWGYAPDFVKAMHRMLQVDQADDFVIATGQLRSLKEFIAIAFSCVELEWEKYVVTDPTFYRPAEAVPLLGDAKKAHQTLGWAPEKPFASWVKEMVESDLALLSK